MGEKDPRLILDGSKTSYPTGEKLSFGEGRYKIPVRLQSGEWTCGEACLEMLGYPLDDLVVDEGVGVTVLDVAIMTGADDILDSIGKEGYRFSTPHMMLGVKRETGNAHWFILVEDSVICPEKGIVNARQYLDEVIDSGRIQVAMPIPFPGPLLAK